jgi:hypothetical protein
MMIAFVAAVLVCLSGACWFAFCDDVKVRFYRVRLSEERRDTERERRRDRAVRGVGHLQREGDRNTTSRVAR